jgi:hypothetical protein
MDTPFQRKKWYKRWWLWALLIIIIFMLMNSAGSKLRKEQDQNAVVQPQAQETSIAVTATKLVADYEANEVAADAQYKGKLVDVSGTIHAIGKDLLDNPYVALSGNSPSMIFNVQCMFEKSDQAQLASLSKGTRITLRGRVSGKLGNVLVRECSIVR